MHNIKTLSKHVVNERMQQRGISMEMVELIDRFGETEYGHGNAMHLYLSRRSIDRMYRAGVSRHLIQQAEARMSLRVVVACTDGTAITIKHTRRNSRAFKH